MASPPPPESKKHTEQTENDTTNQPPNLCTTPLWQRDIKLSDGVIFSLFLLLRQPRYKSLD